MTILKESPMREGSLDAPTRHPLAWREESFYDATEIDKELRRVFDICHGCRRCFNLCDSFPRLFDLVDTSPTEELDGVKSEDFKPIVDACTLCDMCFLTKCPYVPPHEFNLDFPHLMLRYRAMEEKQGKVSFVDRQLAATDRNGKLASLAAPLANWATARDNTTVGPLLRKAADFHPDAELPKFTAHKMTSATAPAVNREAPGFGRKAVLYATCFGDYNNPHIGADLRAVLALNGVETEVLQPKCCGMPLLEQGRIAGVAANAAVVAEAFGPWIDKGYDVIALVPSCALMLKFEWKLILPGDPAIEKLSKATFDISEYIVDIAKKEGLTPGMKPVPGTLSVHMACHARAQNMGQKAAEMLRLIPDSDVKVIERCSGHGGSWGFKKEWFDVAMKIGRPVARQAAANGPGYVMSECPLAGVHIAQGIEKQTAEGPKPELVSHPVQLLARAYGMGTGS